MPRSEELTQQQKDQIKNEVRVMVDSMMGKSERLDAVGLVRYFWDSPDFILLTANGTRWDYQTAKKEINDAYTSFASLKFTNVREDFPVLSNDIVIYAWFGKEDVAIKSGDKMLFDPYGFIMVIKKIAGEWKVVTLQESATIAIQKVGNK